MRKDSITNNSLFNLILLKTYNKENMVKILNYENYEETIFNVFNSYELHKASSEINESWYITADRPVVSHRNLIGRYIVFIKKILRKFLFRWYINPIVESQTKFNSAMTNAMNETIKYISNNEESIQNLKNEIQILKEEVIKLSTKDNKGDI